MKKLSLLATCLLLAIPTLSGAATVSFSTSLAWGFSNGYFSSDPETGSIFLDAADIAGLSRFDPAQGTLNGVSVGITAALDVGADIYDDTGGNLSIEATGLSNINFELVVWDSVSGNGSSTLFFPPAFFDDTVSCVYDGVECFDGVFDIVTIDEFDDITGAGNFNMTDFIGTGLVDQGTLTFGVAYPETLSFIVDGSDEAFVDVYIDDPFSDIAVTITYDYTPVSAVPLPGAFWLMLSGGGLLLGALRRRRGS